MCLQPLAAEDHGFAATYKQCVPRNGAVGFELVAALGFAIGLRLLKAFVVGQL